MLQLRFMLCYHWLVIVAFSQVCNFSHIFCTWLSEEFGFWNFWVFKALYLLQMIVLPQQNTPCVQILALFLAWVDLNSCFLHNSSQFNSCFRKMKILAISHQFSAVNFEKNCQKIKLIWKRNQITDKWLFSLQYELISSLLW